MEGAMNRWIGALCLLSAVGLAGCENSRTQPRAKLVNVIEPGDTALTCPQLGKEITTVSAALETAHENVQDQTSSIETNKAFFSMSQAINTAQSHLNPQLAPQVAANQSLLNGVQQASQPTGERKRDETRDTKSRLEERRKHLVGIYNSRCGGPISQRAPGAAG
jgi:hypothetical protein